MSTSRIKKEVSENPVTTEQVSEVVQQSVTEKKETLIYVGPSIQGLSQYTLLTGGYPDHMQKHLAACTTFKSAFVKPEKLTTFTTEVNVEGSYQNLIFKQIQKYFSEVK